MNSIQYKFALYSLLILSIHILFFSIYLIVYYSKNNIYKNIYFYIIICFGILSLASLVLSIIALFFRDGSKYYNSIIALFIVILIISYLTLNISNLIYKTNAGIIIGYIISGVMTMAELVVIYFLLVE